MVGLDVGLGVVMFVLSGLMGNYSVVVNKGVWLIVVLFVMVIVGSYNGIYDGNVYVLMICSSSYVGVVCMNLSVIVGLGVGLGIVMLVVMFGMGVFIDYMVMLLNGFFVVLQVGL